MTLTEKEIINQPVSLLQTYDYISSKAGAILSWFEERPFAQCIFTGCGSSYSLCRSAEAALRLQLRKPVWSIPSGDLLMNFPAYCDAIDGAVIVALTRSGSTSEVVGAAKLALQRQNVSLVAVTAKSGSQISSELPCISLELPWAFDNSVCQTQTVSNLYLASMMIGAIIAHNDALLKQLKEAVAGQDAFIKAWSPTMKKVAKTSWQKAVVLADGELCGIAEEGALAFNEICRVPSNYYRVLDVRHGPMVLIDSSTLVIAAASQSGALLNNLLTDLKAKHAKVLLVSPAEAPLDVDFQIPVKGLSSAALGLPFISLIQLICLYRALENNINPDQPEGLDPWINLEA